MVRVIRTELGLSPFLETNGVKGLHMDAHQALAKSGPQIRAGKILRII